MKRFYKLCLGFVACLAVAVCGMSPARAQEDSGDLRLDAPKLDGADLSALTALREGRSSVTESDRPLLDKAARWFVYRLTWIEYQEKKYQEGVSLSSDAMSMNQLIQQAYQFIPVPDSRRRTELNPQQLRYIQEFSRPLVVHIKKVLQNPKPIARINAAMILARLGEAGPETLADAYREILADKNQIDAVKFHAVAGLRNLFRTATFQEDGFKSKEREAACVLALCDFLNRKPKFSADTTPEEVEGFRYVRREAIRALGWCRLPAVLTNNKEVIRRPALELLRVVRKDGCTPDVSLSEQIEAVFALSQLQTKLFPDSKFYAPYAADYAVYHVGQFIVEFAARYAERSRTPQTTPWKLQAARLTQALRLWQDDLLNYKYKFTADRAKYVADLLVPCLRILEQIQQDSPADPNRLRDFLQRNPPKENELFTGVAETAIKTPLPSET
jgi:hypothetical protein